DLFAPAHVHAGPVADFNHTDGLELLQGLAHGWMAHAESLRHFHDRWKAIANAIMPSLDHPSDPTRQSVRQALLQLGCERHARGVVSRCSFRPSSHHYIEPPGPGSKVTGLSGGLPPAAEPRSLHRTPASDGAAGRTAADSSSVLARASC